MPIELSSYIGKLLHTKTSTTNFSSCHFSYHTCIAALTQTFRLPDAGFFVTHQHDDKVRPVGEVSDPLWYFFCRRQLFSNVARLLTCELNPRGAGHT